MDTDVSGNGRGTTVLDTARYLFELDQAPDLPEPEPEPTDP